MFAVEGMKNEYSTPKECGMLTTVCRYSLAGWTLGLTGTCIDAPAAIRFGKTRFSGFVIQVCFCEER